MKNDHTSTPVTDAKNATRIPARIGIAGAERPLCASISRILGNQGIHHTVLAEDPALIPRGLPRASAAPLSLDEHLPAFGPFADLDILLLAPAAPAPDGFAREHEIVDTAASAGVRHFVYISQLGAAEDALYTGSRDHYRMEQRIKQTGATFTILRPTLLLERGAELLAPTGHMYGPGGTGRATLLSRHELALTAASTLMNPPTHTGQTYPITGPESFTLQQVAAQLSGTQGHRIRYQPEKAEDTFTRLVDYMVPSWRATAVVSLYESIAARTFALTADAPAHGYGYGVEALPKNNDGERHDAACAAAVGGHGRWHLFPLGGTDKRLHRRRRCFTR